MLIFVSLLMHVIFHGFMTNLWNIYNILHIDFHSGVFIFLLDDHGGSSWSLLSTYTNLWQYVLAYLYCITGVLLWAKYNSNVWLDLCCAILAGILIHFSEFYVLGIWFYVYYIFYIYFLCFLLLFYISRGILFQR